VYECHDYTSDEQTNHRRRSGVDQPGRHRTKRLETVANLIRGMVNQFVWSAPAEVVTPGEQYVAAHPKHRHHPDR
jgi:hypothetical protein